jgi:hypothetical protein
LTFSSNEVKAYNCYNNNQPDLECYAVAVWPGGVVGAKTTIKVVPLGNIGADVTSNQLWLKDDHCGTLPDYCWLEAGYAYGLFGNNHYLAYYWANDSSFPNGSTFGVFGEVVRSDLGQSATFTIQKNGSFYNISVNAPSINQSTSLFTTNFNPDNILIGQRLSGNYPNGNTSDNGGVAPEASFTNNYWFGSTVCTSGCNQNNSGNPANGYVYNPPVGYWATHPESSGTGGDWRTSMGFATSYFSSYDTSADPLGPYVGGISGNNYVPSTNSPQYIQAENSDIRWSSPSVSVISGSGGYPRVGPVFHLFKYNSSNPSSNCALPFNYDGTYIASTTDALVFSKSATCNGDPYAGYNNEVRILFYTGSGSGTQNLIADYPYYGGAEFVLANGGHTINSIVPGQVGKVSNDIYLIPLNAGSSLTGEHKINTGVTWCFDAVSSAYGC